ncbi:MAG: molybdopterin-synthase adenylyltransferase MoeB [Acidobacteriaceae bacterium]
MSESVSMRFAELLYYGETMPSDEPATGHHISGDSLKPGIEVPQTSGTIADADRYSRQVLFPGIGSNGQERLSQGHAAIVGCGATGAAVAALLARAGVGTLTLIDRDFVEPSNLQRQMLYDEADAIACLPKAEAARRHIGLFNSGVTVRSYVADLTPSNVAELLAGAHIILDATDNFETRYLLNDFAVQQGVPWIYSAAIGAYAATMNILPVAEQCAGGAAGESGGTDPATACLACIFPKAPGGTVETCDTAGILSMAVNVAASVQAAEALKFLTGQRNLMRRTLLSFDLWAPAQGGGLERSEISTATPRPDCTVCGRRIFSHLAGEGRAHITLCGRDSVQIHEHHRPVDFAAMRMRLADHSDIRELRANDLLLRFRRGPYTLTVFGDGRAIVQGTTDVTVARSLYARFVGA